ncbi:MAG: NAD(P)H-dependent oxidoreductase [Anaerolineales bacterium]|nr:NAD(P)H-dependent oxidoreductase [Anaerolineales bacterium]
MKITILNGNPEPSGFDQYLKVLKSALETNNHQVTRIDLRELPLKYCIGCFDCWVKTPGICDADDASQEMDRAVINSDFTLWAAPLKMGFPAALMKMALDKHLPLIHPYMVVDQNEAHHLKRYKIYPRVGMLIEKEEDTDAKDLRILTDIFSRTALNFKSKLDFLETTELAVEDLIIMILNSRKGRHLFQRKLGPVPGAQIAPPNRITVFNGSPRGKKGNTPIMLGEFIKGFGGDCEIHHLVRVKDCDQQVHAFQEAECVWIGFPLYTDAMPGIVKNFIEALEPLRGRENNPPIGFLVQSGFPEGLHSRYVERYLERLALRLGSPYLGTIVKGGGEGTRIMPPEATQGLFEKLISLGSSFASSGQLDSAILKEIAKPECYPLALNPVFRLFLRLPIAHGYFDSMLKENDAFERRFDVPFVEQS